MRNERADGDAEPVLYDGSKLAAELKAVKYIGCSVDNTVGVQYICDLLSHTLLDWLWKLEESTDWRSNFDFILLVVAQ
jgi:hypothetical protein